MKKAILLLLALACAAAGDTHTSASAALTDVTTAYGLCANGDTLKIQGNATWSDSLIISKKITVLGVTCSLTAGAKMSQGLMKITNVKADTLIRITGFTFNCLNLATGNKAIYVRNMLGCYSGGKIRIDHNKFYFGDEAVAFYHLKGLVDNNTFYNSNFGVTLDAGSRDYADSSWTSLAAGTDNALYIEDNTFVQNAAYRDTSANEQIGTENGGKLVIRHNTFNASDVPQSWVDSYGTFYPFMSHGNAQSYTDSPVRDGYWERDQETIRGHRRGQSVVEMYDNTISGKRVDYLAYCRGSANLIYNNEITGTVANNPVIYLREEEYEQGLGIFTNPRTSWPAEDQIHNTFIWNNTYRGHDFNDSVYGSVTDNNDVSLFEGVKKNRDYFLHAPQSSGGYESFTNLKGAAGTHPTDGDPYPNYGTMTFSETGANAYYGYTAYTYPHPLRAENKKAIITIVR